jgi:hypothetical protein
MIAPTCTAVAAAALPAAAAPAADASSVPVAAPKPVAHPLRTVCQLR